MLQPPGASRTPKRSAVTGPDGERPTFIIAVESAIAWASARLAEHGVDVGDHGSAEPAPPTQEEMEWLAEWLDAHPAPETIGAEELTAALMQRRKASASSQAGTSSIDASGFTRLYDVQLQRAQLTAAEKQLSRIKGRIERLQAALPEVQAAKKARNESRVPDHPRVAKGDSRGNPHGWEHFHGYTKEKYQEEEVKEQDRCVIEIDRDQREIKPPVDPHTGLRSDNESRGFLLHWRRGVARKLRGWANGSLGVIIFMLAACIRYFDVVDEVGSALGFMPKAQARRAETCIYAMGRAREAFAVLKWCKTGPALYYFYSLLPAHQLLLLPTAHN